MNNKEYHASPGISKSGLDLINKSPAHYRWARENPTEPTAAMRIGTLTHLAVLEPAEFAANCVVVPPIDRRTSAGKTAWADFLAENPGKELMTSDEHTRIIGIRDAIQSHQMAKKLLNRISQVEVSTFWTDNETGVACRCRPDAILDNEVLIDLKTTADAGPGFVKSVRQFRYHVQAAFYAAGTGGMPMIFLAVEKDPPFAVGCYMLDADTLQEGEDAARRNLETYAECLANDTWPAYHLGVQTISIIDYTK